MSGEKKLQDYPQPSVTVDLVLLSVRRGRLEVLLARRTDPPQAGHWALPGGFVGIDESLDEAARRVLRDKVRLSGLFVEQLYTFGAPERDPRGRVITVAYFALVPATRLEAALEAGQGTSLFPVHVPWRGQTGGPARVRDAEGSAVALPFDHGEILGMAVKRLRGRLDYSPVAFALLPQLFTLRQLQEIHEAILDRKLNKPAFRRRMLDKGNLQASGRRESGVTYRPAELYRFRGGPRTGLPQNTPSRKET